MSPLTLLPSAASPDGATSFGAGVSHAPAKEAWQREMERAQTRDWFRHDGAPSQSPAAAPETALATSTSGVAAAPLAAALPPMPWIDIGARLAAQRLVPEATRSDASRMAMAGALPSDSAPPLQATAPVARTSASAAVTPGDDGATVDARRSAAHMRPDAAYLAAHVSAQLGSARSPVRVHVQWHGDTAQVWIGLDAAAALSSTDVAKAVTRWLRHQGQQAGRITCNGVAVDLSASAAGEPPFTPLPPAGPEALSPASHPEVDVVAHLTTREF